MSIRFAFLVFLALMCAGGSAQAAQSSIEGLWMTKDQDGVIQIYPCEGQSYCGRFYWLKDDSLQTPSLDDKNPDPELKKRPLCGLTFLGGFSETENGTFEGGWVYSIRHGSTFSARLKLQDADTLVLRGFVLIPFLGGEQIWKRAPADHPVCPLLVKKDS
jgi:uncharacterized protein (DUF2147 family)